MRTFQITYLLGRLGQNPETRYTAEGQAVTKFSLATDRPTKPGTEPDADWHQVGVSSDTPRGLVEARAPPMIHPGRHPPLAIRIVDRPRCLCHPYREGT